MLEHSSTGGLWPLGRDTAAVFCAWSRWGGRFASESTTAAVRCFFFFTFINCVRDRVSERTGPVRNGRQFLTCCVISLDVQGKTVFLPGLLAKAHRGILYVDDINLLDTELCQILLGIVTDGWVNVEVSLKFQCRAHAMVPTVRCTASVV